MRIDVSDAPPSVRDNSVELGDVYTINGGVGSGRRLRLVVGLVDNSGSLGGRTAYCLILDRDGEIVGADRCGDHYLERKGRVGTCDLSPLEQLKVEWI